jgi:hypothetical protein
VIVVPRSRCIGAAIVGAVCLALAVLVGVTQPATFFQAYLFSYSFWIGLSLGCLGLAFIQFLTGGAWGLIARRIFEAGATCLPLLVVLFVPVLLGMRVLYPWTDQQAVAADPVLQHKVIYLNEPFFVARAVVYLASWLILSWILRRWSIRHDTATDPLLLPRLQRLSIVGLLILPVTASFAAIDWLMSLEPNWFSTMYPVTVCVGDLLLALAFTVLLVALLSRSEPLAALVSPQRLNDFGSLLLAFVMLWAYVTYFQYMLIWAGNLREEITWFVRRAENQWEPVAWSLAGVGFLVPFWLLLFRGLKRNRRWLGSIAGLLIVAQMYAVYWLIEPAFAPLGPSVNLLQLLLWLGIGGLWLALFGWSLSSAPLIPRNDPRVLPALEATAHARA